MLEGRIWPNGECWVGHRPTGSNGLGDRPQKSQSAPKGLKGITSKGRRIVRNGCHLLEELFNPSQLSFLTCTLPGSTIQEAERACEQWGEIMRRFLQELTRELDRHDLPRWIIGCTEIQPKRYERTGQPWPHLHLIFPGWKDGRWVIGTNRVTQLWARVCHSVLGIPLDALQSATTIKAVRGKGAAAKYLSKYMSKGSGEIAAITEVLPDFPLPHQWHHCTHTLNDLIRKGTRTLRPNTAAWLCRLAQIENSGFKVWAIIEPPPKNDGSPSFPLGFYGLISPDLLSILLDHEYQEKFNGRV